MAVAMKYENPVYLNTGTIQSPTWSLLGEGFTSVSDTRNPVVDETTYVNDVSSTKTITGYGAQWDFEGDVIKDNAVIEYLRGIGENELTGADAESEIVTFDLWEVVTNVVTCNKRTVTVQVDTTGGGAGGEKLSFSGSLLAKGDPVSGTWSTLTNTFTEDVS